MRLSGRVIRLAACLSVAGAALLVPGADAAASTPGSFTLQPVMLPGSSSPRSDFSFALEPGQRVTDAVIVANYASVPQTFDLYPADGYNAVNGGLALGRVPVGSTSVAGWIRLAAGRYTVPAHTVATVPFSLTVPSSARAGDHVGGIVALDLASTSASGAHLRVAVHRGVAVAIFARVLGPLRPSVAVTGVGTRSDHSGGGTTVYAGVRNTGNVQLRAEVSVWVTDLFGDTVERFPAVRVPVLVPDSTFTVVEPAFHPSSFGGPDRIHVVVSTDGRARAVESAVFWRVPWAALLVGVVVMASVLWFLVGRRRRRSRTGQSQEVGRANRERARELTKADARPR